jgi:asparagine synthetase B (glutamine-hydrolysing)
VVLVSQWPAFCTSSSCAPFSRALVTNVARIECAAAPDCRPILQAYLRTTTDQEYAACFLDLFTDSVRSRARSREGVAAELSGGLDSASVVCVAATLPEIASASSRLETCSLIFPGMSCDEQPYITEVARAYRLPSRCFVIDRERLVDPPSRAIALARLAHAATGPSSPDPLRHRD